MGDLLDQTLVYTATSNTAIRKSSATPISAETNTNVERQHEEKTFHSNFSQSLSSQHPSTPLKHKKLPNTIPNLQTVPKIKAKRQPHAHKISTIRK